MTDADSATPKGQLAAIGARLVAWLTDSAYPLWAKHAIDPQNGGFIETLAQSGLGLPHARRARVHPRQIYAFAQARGLGWDGDVDGIVRRGIHYFTAHYLRPDGLFRTLVGADGAPMDDRAFLYDQAFALLGYAAAAAALDARAEFEQRALDLRHAIDAKFRASNGAFRPDETEEEFFLSNPHMHLLEACLAWAEIGNDLSWAHWVRQLANLASAKFIRPDTGTLGESFTADWRPAPGIAGRIVEPGHQFEWAWLLLRCAARHPAALREPALRLVAIGESSGVQNRVAINALLDDFSVHDANARLWPQTERLKAALLAARFTGEDHYWAMAAAAAASLFPYLQTPVAGLWLDVLRPSGELVDSAAPASSFYHLVGAIAALHNAL